MPPRPPPLKCEDPAARPQGDQLNMAVFFGSRKYLDDKVIDLTAVFFLKVE